MQRPTSLWLEVVANQQWLCKARALPRLFAPIPLFSLRPATSGRHSFWEPDFQESRAGKTGWPNDPQDQTSQTDWNHRDHDTIEDYTLPDRPLRAKEASNLHRRSPHPH